LDAVNYRFAASRIVSSLIGVFDYQTKRNQLAVVNGGAHSRIGSGFEALSIRIAQAVIVEAELHRRRFPNLACGGSCVHST
jgi:hypothetical protein